MWLSCAHTDKSSLICHSTPCPGRQTPLCPLSWPRAKARARRGHTSSEGTLSCTNSSSRCLVSAADCRTHTSCDRVFLRKITCGSQNQEVRKLFVGTEVFFCQRFNILSPKASLMWPLRPHFVLSSTGLNHMISSDVKKKQKTGVRPQWISLHRPQPRQVCWHPLTSVEEHVADDGGAPVDFERVSAQHDPLQRDALGVTAEQAARSHQVLDA